jgi:glycosyltransferase involved in cell wall biosynthesis
MLGWEFPPFISGGLGTACYGLTRAMSRRGDQVLFVLPGPTNMGFSAAYEAQATRPGQGMRMAGFENVEFHGMEVSFGDPYARQPVFHGAPRLEGQEGPDLFTEAEKFADRVVELALRQRREGRHFDVVHAHDWMTFEAAFAAGKALGLPVVVHVHSTEFDRRAGEPPDEQIMLAERGGLEAADAIIAVSRYTAQILSSRYGIDERRITVVHNALDLDNRVAPQRPMQIGADERVVLFVGRMTQQKGPGHFVRAAARVVAEEPAVRFVMAGTGEQFTQVRHLARELGIEGHFLFTGFLRGEDIEALYRSADVFVMPSVSEPFGLVSIEAAGRDVPVIVSKQSGAAEVLEHALKVDFWDVEETASKILSVLRDPTLAKEMAARGSFEVRQMRWSDAADAVAGVYDRLLRNQAVGS